MIPISGGYTAFSADECKRLEKLLHKLEQESLLIKAETSPHLRRVLDARIDDVARRLALLMAMSPNGRHGTRVFPVEASYNQRTH